MRVIPIVSGDIFSIAPVGNGMPADHPGQFVSIVRPADYLAWKRLDFSAIR
jgi:hypothetical protein